MEAKFTGRLGQTVDISGTPEQIATTYAYLLAADIGSINAMEAANQKPPKPTSGRYPLGKDGGYVDPPEVSQFEGKDPEAIYDALLDWVNDMLRRKRDDDDDE